MIPTCIRHRHRHPSPVCAVCLRLLVSWAAVIERWAREVLREARRNG